MSTETDTDEWVGCQAANIAGTTRPITAVTRSDAWTPTKCGSNFWIGNLSQLFGGTTQKR
jgi:hypothetical protein